MTQQSQPLKAALWMIGAMVSFSVMAVAGRELAPDLNTFQIMFFRSLIGLVIVLVVAGAAGTLTQIKTDRLGLHLLRNTAHFSGQNLWFLAVAYIPFSQLFALEFSTPIWVAMLAPIFLGETLTRRRLLTVALGFIGVLIVARPDLSQFDPAIIAAIACAVCFAGSLMATKKLTADQSITCILFWLTVMQLGMGAVATMITGGLVMPHGVDIVWVLSVGCGGLMAHFCITRGLALAPAIVVIPLDFMRLPLISVIGFLAYGEAFEWPIIVGALIILIAIVNNLRGEQPRRQVSS
ncbi:MAG: DMT family transporter [Alphaproteobacteria bacterium]|nr:DMT family transporter [Alphaproteobacteria bacterium]